MCPELCARRLVTSPVTQTQPISFSSNRRTFVVNSETVKTRRVAAVGNNSPKSHCDFDSLGICLCRQLLRHPLNPHRPARAFINFHHRSLQQHAPVGHAEAL